MISYQLCIVILLLPLVSANDVDVKKAPPHQPGTSPQKGDNGGNNQQQAKSRHLGSGEVGEESGSGKEVTNKENAKSLGEPPAPPPNETLPNIGLNERVKESSGSSGSSAPIFVGQTQTIEKASEKPVKSEIASNIGLSAQNGGQVPKSVNGTS